MNKYPSQETLDSLNALAMQQIQSDIAADKMWMYYNPYVIAVLAGIIIFCVLLIMVNEVVENILHDYNRETRFGINVGAIIVGIATVLAVSIFGLGYLMASDDYNFKTTAPEAAAYKIVISHLYNGG